ncbi:MAG: hypothetical protein IJT41_03900 [Clostridia bacterium]|nr:hypothetical protein [Clostridia bacterium]
MHSGFIKALQSFLLIFSMLFSRIGVLIEYPAVKAVEALHEKTGGYVFGITEPFDTFDGDYDRLHMLGTDWIRSEIPYPFTASGQLSDGYLAFKQSCASFAARGIKVLGITPVPRYFFAFGGFDPVAPENYQKTKDVAVFLCNDLRDVIGGLQVANELNLTETFGYPLGSEEDCVLFTGLQLEALYDIKGDLIVGYNTSSTGERFHKLMAPYYKYCDYVGTDMYYSGIALDYTSRIRKIHRITKLPVLLLEVGYKGAGAPKTDAERLAILQSYGYDSEASARADIENFAAKLPANFQMHLRMGSEDPADWGDLLFDTHRGHFYREISGKLYKKCAHTPDGQAAYFRDLLPKLLRLKCLAGIMVFRYKDARECWFCGFPDCPHETSFGLVDANGCEKPAYYAVQEVVAAYRSAA